MKQNIILIVILIGLFVFGLLIYDFSDALDDVLYDSSWYIYEDGKLKALVSVTIDQDLAVHDIKVIEGSERLFVAMPSRKDDNGVFRDIVHPITMEGRKTLEGLILEEYHKYLSQQEVYSENAEKSHW